MADAFVKVAAQAADLLDLVHQQIESNESLAFMVHMCIACVEYEVQQQQLQSESN